MTLKDQLNARVEDRALLKHPFYKAWEAGELPKEALQAYAREYGAFIALMPKGWESLRDSETAQEEREHIALWQDFAAGLDTEISEAELPAIVDLVKNADRQFAQPVTALGALYAFEVQQPETAKSKLEGLQTHYNLPESVEPYFVEHTNNQHEAEKLLERISELSVEEQAAALDACESMSVSLWDALTDIYDTHCKM